MIGSRIHAGRTAVLLVLIAVLAAALAGGCGKQETTSSDIMEPPPAAPSSTPPADEGVMPPPPPASPLAGSEAAGAAGDSGAPAPPPPSLDDVRFEFDRYDLTAAAREVLARDARQLESAPAAAVVVEGHCDERGTIEYNLALGEKRAAAVHDYLVRYGIDAQRLRTVSYGEERPADPRSTEEAWAANRRAHLRLQQ